jgi:hypothetical protein
MVFSKSESLVMQKPCESGVLDSPQQADFKLKMAICKKAWQPYSLGPIHALLVQLLILTLLLVVGKSRVKQNSC